MMQPSAGERIGVVEQRLYADQVDWKLGWPEDEHGTAVPWIRYRSTRADVEDHYRTLGDYHVSNQASVDFAAILVDGADAAIIGELGQTLGATGVTYRAAFRLYLTISCGTYRRAKCIGLQWSAWRTGSIGANAPATSVPATA